jgi:hypothetical protein
MIESLFGGLLGGLLRLAPEFLKVWDRKGEREHEFKLLRAEIEYAELRTKLGFKVAEMQAVASEVDAIGVAVQEQGLTARAAGKVIAGISALVRPVVTYAFVITYFLVKFASYLLALEQGGEWKEVLISMWNKDDMAMLMLILTFWFVGRVWDRSRNGV